LNHEPSGGEVGALHSDLGIVLGNQDEDRYTIMIGEGQLLLVLADLPCIKRFNDIFKEGDEGGTGTVVEDKVEFEVLSVFGGTHLVVRENLYEEGQWKGC
jgi:hypothetical protein